MKPIMGTKNIGVVLTLKKECCSRVFVIMVNVYSGHTQRERGGARVYYGCIRRVCLGLSTIAIKELSSSQI